MAAKVGVIGAGWAGDLHLEAFAKAGAELVGLYSRTRERAEETARRHGVAHVVDSLDELLGLGVDVVSIASPPPAHHAQTLAAVKAGRHVLCDKPMAMNSVEAAEMLAAAEEAGVRHATGFIWRNDPALGRLRSLLAEGAIGRVLEIHSTCPLGAPPMPMHWIYDRDAGGGALMQHGSHVIDRVRWLLGAEIVSLCGRLLHDVTDAPVGPEFHNTMKMFGWSRQNLGTPREDLPRRPVTADSGYDFLAELDTGARARFWESTHGLGPVEDQLLVIGEEGSLSWSPRGLEHLRPGRPAERITTAAAGSGSSTPHEVGMARWVRLTTAFLASLDGGPVDHPTLHDGLQLTRITDALHRSHHSRSWESV
ncbi:Gfo/Idh/MocA family protein [Streptomyces eurythermus]|uniref:Gfo/Idh/MocA family protein n=1 Tax=Streptomyces eurythermus TaxID=42237 RepID=UPI0036A8A7FC